MCHAIALLTLFSGISGLMGGDFDAVAVIVVCVVDWVRYPAAMWVLADFDS